jgi:HK97 family phage major capsid protein
VTTATDSMVARLEGELNERQAFIEGTVRQAEDGGRDLSSGELESIGRARARIQEITDQAGPLREASRIAAESRARMQQIDQAIAENRRPGSAGPVEYRSASEYMLDRWRAGLRMEDAMQRMDLYHRAAAHQTTADNPGIIPQTLLEPIINYLDAARPLVNALGPRPIPGNGFVSEVTQHTQVGKQSTEKAELASRKMLITKTALAPDTFGGYVNVSRQDIDWSDPNALDVVIADLTDQYAIETEAEACDVLETAATAGPEIPTAATALDISKAIWSAAGSAYAATKGLGSLVLAVAPDMLGYVGPFFPAVGATNAISTGLTPSNFGQGGQGVVGGIQLVMSAGLAAGSMLFISTAACHIFEDRVGALQVVEPSVLGVQVAYAGYFKARVKKATGIISVTVEAEA